jgi:hypothetical protein
MAELFELASRRQRRPLRRGPPGQLLAVARDGGGVELGHVLNADGLQEGHELLQNAFGTLDGVKAQPLSELHIEISPNRISQPHRPSPRGGTCGAWP